MGRKEGLPVSARHVSSNAMDGRMGHYRHGHLNSLWDFRWCVLAVKFAFGTKQAKWRDVVGGLCGGRLYSLHCIYSPLSHCMRFLDVDVGSHDICAVSLLSVSFGETA